MRGWRGVVFGVAVAAAAGTAALWLVACLALDEENCEPCVPSSRRANASVPFSPEDPEVQDELAACLADDLRCGELCLLVLGPLPPNTSRTIEQCFLTEDTNGDYRAHIEYIQRTTCPDPYDCPEPIDAAPPDAAPADASLPDGSAPDGGAIDAGANDASGTDA